MHYNPLAYIKNESDILKFVNALISNTKGEGKEGDPFWTKAETLLYCALLGYIIFEGAEEDRNMNTLVDMISGMEVKEDDEDFMNAVDYMFAGLERRKPDCFAVKQYKKYKLSSGKTAKSILISCGARSMHYIRYDILYSYVLSRLQYWYEQVQQDEEKLLKRLLNTSDKERNATKKKLAAELKKAEKRKAEVDGLFAKMYEDWSAGRITEYNFNMLSERYQSEQRELDSKIQQLREEMEAAVQTAVDAENWIDLIKQCSNPTELTAELLNTLIEKIVVHEAVKNEDGSRKQK